MSDLQLETLEARGLIRVAVLQPELEYLFRHALLQDTAYESLLKQERRALHHVVGEALEDLYPDRVGELAAVLARHFEQAGETEKAIAYLVNAAEFAADRNAIVEAFDLYSRAAGLLPPPDEADDQASLRRRVSIQLGRARSGFSFMSEADAIALLEPIIDDAYRAGDRRLEAEVHVTLALLRQFGGEQPHKSPKLQSSLDRAAAIARELDDPLMAALPESIIGLFRVFKGDLRGGLEMLEKTAPLLEQKHDFVGSSFAMVALAIGYARMGEFAKADNAVLRAKALAESGDLIARLDSMIGASTVSSIRGDLAQAIPMATQCANLAEESGAVACVVASNFVLGDAYMRQGQFGAAKIALERGNEVALTIAERQFRPSLAAYLRSNAASLGEFVAGTDSLDEALAESRARDDQWSEASILWQRAEAESKRSVGDVITTQVLADYAAAATFFEESGARPYLARVLRDWGEALGAAGHPDESEAKLRQALALFEELGITREADEVRSQLSAA